MSDWKGQLWSLKPELVVETISHKKLFPMRLIEFIFLLRTLSLNLFSLYSYIGHNLSQKAPRKNS